MDQLVAVVGGVEGVLEVEAHRKHLSLVVDAREDNSREDFVGLDVVQQVQDCREVVGLGLLSLTMSLAESQLLE